MARAVGYQKTPGIMTPINGMNIRIIDIAPIDLAHRLALKKTSMSLTTDEAKRHSRNG